MTRARERLLGVLLLLTGVLALAGAAGELGSLEALPELAAAVAALWRDHEQTLRPAGYLLAGGSALVLAAVSLNGP